MIYFDNAATTMSKPPEVGEAILAGLSSFGGVGRGVHPASLAAGRAVFEARRRVAELLGAPSPSCVSFANNATMALNIALQGSIQPGSHVVTTAASHNSVLRPLFRLRDKEGVRVDVAPIDREGALDFDAYERLLASGDVSVVAATHASNLTGDVYDVARMAEAAHEAGAIFILDAAQTAGAIPVSMADLGVDILCFTGHKSLMGPQGTGGLCVLPNVEVEPLLEGGSGTHTFDERHPRYMPEALEAGTINAHGLAGLAAGVKHLQELGMENVAQTNSQLTERFEAGACAIPGVRVLGGHAGIDRTPIVALVAEGTDTSALADLLATDYEICTRAGAHCAPLMHRSLGTEETGAVRFSFSHLNTVEEIDVGLAALEDCVQRLRTSSL